MNIIHKIPRMIQLLRDNWNGIVREDFFPHGYVKLDHYRKGELIHHEEGHNTFTTEGIARILNTFFGSTGKAASPIVYCGLFKGNVTPALGDTAAVKLGAAGTYQECQDADYTPATNKPVYTIASTATAGCTNDASKASFTMAAAINVYGTFLSLGQAKTDTTGPLICGKRFDSAPRATQIADVLAITYAITVTTS